MTVSTLAAQDPLPQIPAPTPLTQLPGTPVTLTLPAPPEALRWSAGIPAAPSSSPIIVGGRVFLATLPGLIFAFDLKDGREVWQVTINVDRPLAADGDLLVVASGEAVHALRQADGTVAWRRPTGTLTAPLLAKDGWVVAATADKLFALRAADGTVVWSVESGPQRQRAAIEGDTLYVPLANGRLRALDLTTGRQRWEHKLEGQPVEPLVVGGRVYFGASDKKFYCVSAATGQLDWKSPVGAAVRGSAATDGDRVFFVALDNLVRALGRTTGGGRWYEGVPFRPFSGPVMAGSSVIVAGPTAEVRQLSPITGKQIAKITFPEPLAIAPAIVSRADGLFVAGVTGGLTEAWKLWLASPSPLAK